MAEVVLFHHVQGLTAGVRALAEQLAAGRHTVHTPDLLDAARPETVQAGIALTRQISDDELDRRVEAALADLPSQLVYAGISFGAGIAQRLAQTRAGAAGALLYEACVPLAGDWAFGPWPDGVPVQIHGMAEDPFFALEGDLDAARQLVETVGPELAQLFVYPGDGHLFTDKSLPSYDSDATRLVVQRSLSLLDRVG